MLIGPEHKKNIQDNYLNYVWNLPIPSSNEYNISVYLEGHDRSVVISKGRNILEVIEVERLINLKNGDFEVFKVAKNYPTNSFEHTTTDLYTFYLSQIFGYVNKKYPRVIFNNLIGSSELRYVQTTLPNIIKIKYNNFIKYHHHTSHALGVFYQSPYNEALAFTYDGGSPDDIKFAVYYLSKSKPPVLVDAFTKTIVGRYADLGLLFKTFEWQPAKASQTLCGKIMALASFGKPNLEILDYYKNVISSTIHPSKISEELTQKYKQFNPDDFLISRQLKYFMDQGLYPDSEGQLKKGSYNDENVMRIFKYVCNHLFLVNELLEKENISNSKELASLAMAFKGINYLKYINQYDSKPFHQVERIDNEKAFNMAATLQLACEELFFEYATPYLERYPKVPIVLAGGGALNIVLNSRIVRETKRPVFVGPDPSDCGIALGSMLGYLRPEAPQSDPYNGLPILDIDSLSSYVMEYVGINSDLSKYRFIANVKTQLQEVAQIIFNGKILGVMRGKSERGPRALGNRSIICSATIPFIKDKLNAKIKFREWFRPFAPIVRFEDVNKYFEWNKESRYMNFCINVRKEFKEALHAITHVDGTARVQTIKRDQNWFMYDLLSELNNISGIGVLVNTSFNVNGRPLINTVKDAFHMLEKTELDGIIVENTLIFKK